MSVTVRPFTVKDSEAFLGLHRACMQHYEIPPATQAQEERIISLLLAERHMACHLAFDCNRPVGFASWGLNFPAGAGISLVMKELFVSPEARKKGVGRSLLYALVDVARAEGCVRFDWATDGSNGAAQHFYAALAAPEMAKRNYRVSKAEFDSFQERIANI